MRMHLIGVGMGALALAAACGGGNKGKAGGDTTGMGETMSGERPDDLKVPKVDATLCRADGADRRVAAYDLNHDDQPDMWKIYRTKNDGGTKLEVLTCKQVDLDRDPAHRKDYVVQYDDAGNILLEEFDFDFDGKFDARRHYDTRNGQKILVERNTDFDEKPDLWEEYGKTEKVDRLLRDRNADGKPDYWELYREGSLETILYDEDFDGKVDKREDAVVAAPPTVVPPMPAATDAAPAPAPAEGAATPPK